MFCKNCGVKIDPNMGCCLRCGTMISRDSNDNTIIKSNPVSNEDTYIPSIEVPNKASCLITNGIIVTIVVSLIFLLSNKMESVSESIAISIAFLITYFYFFCTQLLFLKAGLPWYGIFIPIYNIYLECKLAFGNGWLFLVLLSPSLLLLLLLNRELALTILPLIYILRLLSSIFPLIMLFCIGRKFGRSGILTVLFGFVIIPSIAFSDKYYYLG